MVSVERGVRGGAGPGVGRIGIFFGGGRTTRGRGLVRVVDWGRVDRMGWDAMGGGGTFAVEAAGDRAPGGVDVVWVDGDVAAGGGGGRGCGC